MTKFKWPWMLWFAFVSLNLAAGLWLLSAGPGGGMLVQGMAVVTLYNAAAALLYLGTQWFFYRLARKARANGRWPVSQYSPHFRGPKITVIGGGTGLSTLLRGLKKYTGNLTAVVTTADDGGSSGELRQAFGILPPGDIRNCIIALADQEPLMERLFQYRFRGEKGLAGHNFGNLFIAAMNDITGDFEQAIEEFSKVLAIAGRVVPATLKGVTLCAETADGEIVSGESVIPQRRKPIRRIFLQPDNIPANPAAVRAILDADCIILGPGSLYTSILPNLVLPEIAGAIHEARGIKIYICNVMTQPGETEGYGACQHVRAIKAHCPGLDIMETVVVNTEEVPLDLLMKYRAEGAEPVRPDQPALEKEKLRVVGRHVISKTSLVRHDPEKLARLLLQLIIQEKFRREGIDGSLLKWLTVPSLISLVSGPRNFPQKIRKSV
ncbi:MAG: gluconeogenesis factor YvcK family protein [Bacillota bacterium]